MVELWENWGMGTLTFTDSLARSLSIKLIITRNLKQEIWALWVVSILEQQTKNNPSSLETRGTSSFWHESSAHTIRSRWSNLEDSTNLRGNKKHAMQTCQYNELQIFLQPRFKVWSNPFGCQADHSNQKCAAEALRKFMANIQTVSLLLHGY